MLKPIKQIVEDYLSFSKKDRAGILILCTLILLSIVVNIGIEHFYPTLENDYSDYEELFDNLEKLNEAEKTKQKKLFPFNPNIISKEEMDSLDIPDFIKSNIVNYRNAGGKFTTKNHLRKIYGMNDSVYSLIEDYIIIESKNKRGLKPHIERKEEITGYFDPNQSDSIEFAKYGFNPYQIKNILKYRYKGGVFNKAEDLAKIYGVDSIFFNGIKNHIKIYKESKVNTIPSVTIESLVDLNLADSLELVQLNGIGPVFAHRIIKYRNLLGGFHSSNQLKEVYNFPEETFKRIEKYISVDSTLVKPLRINFCEFSDMLRHPYLNKKDVEAILNYKKNHGSFNNKTQFFLVNGLDSLTVKKIWPYFSCR